MNRRNLLLGTAALAGVAGYAVTRGAPALAKVPDLVPDPSIGTVTKTEEEWRAILSPAEFEVLREEGTERPFTSPLNDITEPGTFACAGCDLPLYRTEWKFKSGTGWPSFWQGIEGHLGTKEDRGFFMVRTEVHCGRCEGHLGHIFEDGPKPTGLRHCINGVAMRFTPEGDAKS